MIEIALSTLIHTWLIDLDGVVTIHNGYKESGDELLPGVIEFWSRVPPDDYIIILTARSSKFRDVTELFLKNNGIRYNAIIFDLPYGERIVINDKKPLGLLTAKAININRDVGLGDIVLKLNSKD
jgi:hypothetical protein